MANTDFAAAWKELPASADADPAVCKTVADLVWACRLQLDLIEEGQDGAEDDDPKPLRRFIKKWSR
jgi:hypothetical protein